MSSKCTEISSSFVLTTIGNITIEWKEDIMSAMKSVFQNFISNMNFPTRSIGVNVYPVEDDVNDDPSDLNLQGGGGIQNNITTDENVVEETNEEGMENMEGMEEDSETEETQKVVDTEVKDMTSSSSNNLEMNGGDNHTQKNKAFSSFLFIFTLVAASIAMVAIGYLIWMSRKNRHSSNSVTTVDEDSEGYGFEAPSHVA